MDGGVFPEYNWNGWIPQLRSQKYVGQEETALYALYSCKWVHPFGSHIGEWTARIDPKQLVLLDVGYVVDNVDPLYWGEKRVVFLAILAVVRMVIWTTCKKGLYDDVNFSHRDLILFFRHQLKSQNQLR